MHIDAELASWIRLSLVPGLGNDGQLKLLQAFGTPDVVLSTPIAILRQYVRPAVAEAIFHSTVDEAMVSIDSWLDDPANRVITLADTDYPQALLNIPDPPFLLYIKGRLDLLNQASFAVVGSRNASVQGVRNAEAFAQALSESALCIVSGMAHGIDAAAHLGGLIGQGSSIGVVGTGLDKVYPAANRNLAHRLAAEGMLISEFPLGTPPLAHNFPRRNRIISGLSLGCLVVEASLQSGSLITARMALEQGREIFAIPGSIHTPQAKGCHALIKQGAKLVENPNDILEELSWYSANANHSISKLQPHPIFEYLGFDPLDMGSLSQRSGLTIEELSAILLQLELEGQVTALNGGLYQRII